MPTLESLLLLPRDPKARPDAAAAASPPQRLPAASTPKATGARATARVDRGAAERAGADPRSPAEPPSRLGIELSVLGGARIGDGQRGFGLGALSLLDLGDWLVGFEGRTDRYESIAGGMQAAALELAALAGRRFPFRWLSLDLVAGPALALGGESRVSIAEGSPPNNAASMQTTTTRRVPRLLLGARLSLGAGSVLRSFVGIDGELGPRRELAPAANPPEAGARLPAWSVGLALGATMGTR